VIDEFAGVSADFLAKVCEALLSQTSTYSPSSRETMMGGVALKLFVDNHWSGFERYMLVGKDWTVGFNLSEPAPNAENLVQIFKTKFELSKPHLTGEHAFLRDMTVLRVTASAGGWEKQIS
jgi:hypothetical protein